MDTILLFTPLFFLFILGIAILVFLLPNIAIIWLLRKKLHISQRIGINRKNIFFVLPVVLGYIGYYILSTVLNENLVLGVTCYAFAIMASFIAIDYCLVSDRPAAKIFGTFFYFVLLSFSEFVVYEVIEKSLYRWEPPVGLL